MIQNCYDPKHYNAPVLNLQIYDNLKLYNDPTRTISAPKKVIIQMFYDPNFI